MRLSIVVALAESHLEKLRQEQRAAKESGDDERVQKLDLPIASMQEYLAELQAVPKPKLIDEEKLITLLEQVIGE